MTEPDTHKYDFSREGICFAHTIEQERLCKHFQGEEFCELQGLGHTCEWEGKENE